MRRILFLLLALAAGPAMADPASIWTHNGSTVALYASGNSREFRYDNPRQGIRNEGVGQGTVLFRGIRDGSSYSGTAYVFSSRCGALGYQVAGQLSGDERQIELFGSAPTRLDNSCRPRAYRQDKLVFDLSQVLAAPEPVQETRTYDYEASSEGIEALELSVSVSECRSGNMKSCERGLELATDESTRAELISHQQAADAPFGVSLLASDAVLFAIAAILGGALVTLMSFLMTQKRRNILPQVVVANHQAEQPNGSAAIEQPANVISQPLAWRSKMQDLSEAPVVNVTTSSESELFDMDARLKEPVKNRGKADAGAQSLEGPTSATKAFAVLAIVFALAGLSLPMIGVAFVAPVGVICTCVALYGSDFKSMGLISAVLLILNYLISPTFWAIVADGSARGGGSLFLTLFAIVGSVVMIALIVRKYTSV